MKTRAVNQPLLFVDTVSTECQVAQQVMYKTPQVKPEDIHQSDFVHAFDTLNVTTTKNHQSNSLNQDIIMPIDDEVVEIIEIQVDEDMTQKKGLVSTTKELNHIVQYLIDVMADVTNAQYPMVQIHQEEEMLIGQLQFIDEQNIKLQLFNQDIKLIPIETIQSFQILQL